MAFGSAGIFDQDVLPLDIADFAEALAESGKFQLDLGIRAGVKAAEETYHRQSLLLRAGGEQWERGRARGEPEEVAAPHSMTSSARASSEGGIVSPKAFATLRLRPREILGGCWIGRSPGLAPRSILST